MFFKADGSGQPLTREEVDFWLRQSAARIEGSLEPRCSRCHSCEKCWQSRDLESYSDSQTCEKMWNNIHFNKETGRYRYDQFYVPFKGYDVSVLQSNEKLAYYRYLALESQLQKKGKEFTQKFDALIQEKFDTQELMYLDDYAKIHPEILEVPLTHISINFALKTDSEKIRPIFDTILPTTVDGIKLTINDFLPNPQLQKPIQDVFTTLRFFKYSAYCDVKSYFTNVELSPTKGVNRTVHFYREGGYNSDGRIRKVVSTRNQFGYSDSSSVTCVTLLKGLFEHCTDPELANTWFFPKTSPLSYYIDDFHVSVSCKTRLCELVKLITDTLKKFKFEK